MKKKPGRYADGRGHDGGDKDEGGKFDGITYLYIRTNPQDTGAEPLPAGLASWTSPDIRIEHAGGTLDTEVTVNEPVNVRVTVTNAGGIAAQGAVLETFVSEPSTSFNPANAHLIGTTSLTVQGYSTASVSLPWTPGLANEGHRCLAARVALYVPPDRFRDPAIFDVVGDRHVAQRNIHVFPAPSQASAFFGFRIFPPARASAGRFRLSVREVDGGKQGELVRRSLGSDFAQFAPKPAKLARLALDRQRFIAARNEPLDREKLPRVGLIKQPPKPAEWQADKDLHLQPGEIATAYLEVIPNHDTRPGDLHVLEVTQVDAETKAVIGGLWLVLQQPK
jgi:hypothetical protein